MPILVTDDVTNNVDDKDILSVDFTTGEIYDKTMVKDMAPNRFQRFSLKCMGETDC